MKAISENRKKKKSQNKKEDDEYLVCTIDVPQEVSGK